MPTRLNTAAVRVTPTCGLLRFEKKFVVCIIDRPRFETFEKRLAK